jgi:spore maturation protein CgeB
MTNILREPFVESQTVMSLQVFAVLASSVCLLTEWVQEIEDAFEPDSEILTFRDPHEFREKAIRYSREPAAARRIGEAGRKRCLSEHTHTHRAQNLLRRVLDC